MSSLVDGPYDVIFHDAVHAERSPVHATVTELERLYPPDVLARLRLVSREDGTCGESALAYALDGERWVLDGSEAVEGPSLHTAA